MSMKCLVLDDEPLAIDVISNYLERLPGIVQFSSSNVIEAFHLLQAEKIDLLFLDIEMPLLSGLDFLKTMKTPPAVIITTAHRDYAVESFELDVIDYLVKPISFPRFMKAFEKAGRHLQLSHTVSADNDADKNYLFLKVSGKLVKVAINEILFIESLKDYIRVVTAGSFWISYQTLTSITEKLPGDKFIRIHRSFTIALDKVTTVEAGGVEINGKLIPISRDLRQDVIKRITRDGASS